MIRTKIKCELCGREIIVNNYSRHLKSHENGNFDKINSQTHLDHDDLFCKYCGKECKNRNSLAQHEIRCRENPNHKSNNSLLTHNNKLKSGEVLPWNKGLSKETDERIKKYTETYRKNHKLGLHKKSNDWLNDAQKRNLAVEKLRISALKNHLGWSNTGKIIEYKGVKLNSSYELKVAQELDSNMIRWERPGGIPYNDNKGKFHNYIPDFYLPDYDIYLEPKNNYLIENVNTYLGFYDLDKLKWVSEQNNVKIILLTVDELTWDSIKKKINNEEFI